MCYYSFISKLKGNIMERKSCLEICFGGENEIDLSTLTKSLESTLNCLTKIANRSNIEDRYCRFVVKSIEPGSFKILIDELLSKPQMFVEIVSSIIVAFASILEIRKHLKGKEPKLIIPQTKEKNIVIVNHKEENFVVKDVVFNIYTSDNDIEKEFANISETVSKDSSRTNIKITAKDIKSNKIIKEINYDEADLKATSNSVDVEKLSNEFIEESHEILLRIKKVCFVGDAKWDFICPSMNNQTISASIEDKEWLQFVQDGQYAISSNMAIRAMLRCRYKKDKQGNAIGKISYAVTKVLKVHSPTDVQIKFDM